MLTKDSVEILEKEGCYKGFFEINRYTVCHKLFNGELSKPYSRELFERGHAAAVLLYDSNLDKVVLIEQFRIGALIADYENPWLIEVVAGIIEDGEDSKEVVIRETMEEAGISISDVKFALKFLVSPGGTSETISLYIANVDSSQASGVFGLKSENEDIKVSSYDFSEVMKMVEQGKIVNVTTIVALYYLALHKEEFRV